MEQEKYEIVKFVDNGFELEVNVSPSEDTVWLTQNEISQLFDTARSSIAYHIGNLFNNKEVDESTSVEFFDRSGRHRPSKYYNLDVILAVGYKVNSKRGIVFRRWATSVLKQYMLKGYAIDSARTLVTNENYQSLLHVVTDMKSSQINLEKRVEKLESKHPELNTFVYACGQVYDATSFMGQIMEKAKKDIILIDNYVDRGTLDILSHKNSNVRIRIITSNDGNRITAKEQQTFNDQYGNLQIEITGKVHDHFLVLDSTEMYHIGASLKYAGKKLFGMDLIKNPEIIRFILENAI